MPIEQRTEKRQRPITQAERDTLTVLKRCPAVAADFEKSCAKEALRILPHLSNKDPKHALSFVLTEAIEYIVHKRRRGAYHYDKKGAGNCYDAALETMAFTDDDPKLDARLVHGRIIDGKGRSCPHAWLEVGGLCIDPSNHRDWPLIVGRDRFYEIMKVDPKQVFRYTRAEAIELNHSHCHYGPWKGPDAVPPCV